MKTVSRVFAVLMSLCMILGTVALFGVSAEDAAADLDNDPGTLTYKVSEDGSTVTISYQVGGETKTYTVPNQNNYNAGGYYCVDDLDRPMYTSQDVGSYGSTGEKYVGLFYFVWQGMHGDTGIFDLQKIIDEKGIEIASSVSKSKAYSSEGAMHWFAEPLYGYYYANDEWVHRKHMELLTYANIDFLYFDFTNGLFPGYIDNALQVMKACHELNEQGFDAPQVVFYTHTGSASVVRGLYDAIYKKGLYADTWFCVDGKPCIVAEYTDNIDDFFTVKLAQWPNASDRVDGWPWMDFTWPQRIFPDKNGTPSAISVSIAQHSGTVCFSHSSLYGNTTNRGRSFTYVPDNPKRTTVPPKYLKEAWQKAQDDPSITNLGLNFQDQWNRAIEADVPYVLVTGWNEWVAQRQPGGDQVIFIDTASMEYSRDAEMMRGGYFDNYYIQLAYNVQKLKGTAPVVVQDSRKAIDVNGSFDQWDSVLVAYKDWQGDTTERHGTGFGKTKYENTTGNNDIVAAKVTSDTKNIYFYVECAENITEPNLNGDASWMQLFINTDNATTGWYGFDYIVNYIPDTDTQTRIGKYIGSDNAYDFAISTKIDYRIEGNKMMLAVPQSAIGIPENHYRELNIQFKWVDSDSLITTMEQFYEDGDCAPLGRMNFVYQNYIPGIDVDYPEFATEAPTAAPTEAPTDAPTEAPTAAPTEAGTEDATIAATDGEATGAANGGCASVLTLAVLPAVIGCAVLMLKKKH